MRAKRDLARLGWAGLAGAASLACAVQAAAEAPVHYVLMGEAGVAIARAVTTAGTCPDLLIDGRPTTMAVRAGPAILALRPPHAKPSDFPVTVCEAVLPSSARRASLGGEALPLPKARFDRLLVIGDTGCRLKAADKAFQACLDPKAFPFAALAARAAAWKPDLIVHVGDYHYRESPCPNDKAALCGDSPWGYGWDAWKADFFGPGAPLLVAAPLALARGNHENCARAGQGWYRLLDVRPLGAGHDCNDPAQDFAGDYSAPYAVPLGGGAQIVIMDLAVAGYKALTADDPRAGQFRSAYADLASLAKQARSTIMVTHKPILGFGANDVGGKIVITAGTPGIGSVFAAQSPALFPKGVDVLLAGHIHLWEQVGFRGDLPSQFIVGFSGTLEDTVPLPVAPPADLTPAPGAVVETFSSWVDGFGYMTLERAGARRWTAKVWDLDGRVVNRCRIEGRRSSCDHARVMQGKEPK